MNDLVVEHIVHPASEVNFEKVRIATSEEIPNHSINP